MHKSQRRRDHLGLLRTHAAARIKNDSNGNRTVLRGELLDGLGMAVFEDAEILHPQTSYVGSMSILHAHIEHYQSTRCVQSEFRSDWGIYCLGKQCEKYKGQKRVVHDELKMGQVARATCPVST